jgi:hypothetical protein
VAHEEEPLMSRTTVPTLPPPSSTPPTSMELARRALIEAAYLETGKLRELLIVFANDLPRRGRAAELDDVLVYSGAPVATVTVLPVRPGRPA